MSHSAFLIGISIKLFFPLPGTVLLDLESFDLNSIFDAVVENMVITDQLSRAHKEKVVEVLLSKHRHQHQQNKLKRSFSFSSLSSFTFDTPSTPRDKDSGVESAIEMELKKEADTGKENIVTINDTAVDDEKVGETVVETVVETAVETAVETNKTAENSVVFEIGDIDIDEEDLSSDHFLKESRFTDSSDDEKVRQDYLFIGARLVDFSIVLS